MHIFLINPDGDYQKLVFCSILSGLTQLFIGATVSVTYLYTVQKPERDLHVLLCTLGYHFFTAEAILSFSYVTGWSSPLRLRHKKCVHVLLQLCALTCVLWGTLHIIYKDGIVGVSKFHRITGFMAALFAIISAVTGVFAFGGKNCCKQTHVTFGIPAFLVSSISLCTGFYSKPFQDWVDSTIVIVLISVVIFYTTFITTTSFVKCLTKI